MMDWVAWPCLCNAGLCLRGCKAHGADGEGMDLWYGCGCKKSERKREDGSEQMYLDSLCSRLYICRRGQCILWKVCYINKETFIMLYIFLFRCTKQARALKGLSDPFLVWMDLISEN